MEVAFLYSSSATSSAVSKKTMLVPALIQRRAFCGNAFDSAGGSFLRSEWRKGAGWGGSHKTFLCALFFTSLFIGKILKYQGPSEPRGRGRHWLFSFTWPLCQPEQFPPKSQRSLLSRHSCLSQLGYFPLFSTSDSSPCQPLRRCPGVQISSRYGRTTT